MDHGSATVLTALIALVGTIVSAAIVARATIYAARLRETHRDNVRPTEPYEKQDHRVQDQVTTRRKIGTAACLIGVFLFISGVIDPRLGGWGSG